MAVKGATVDNALEAWEKGWKVFPLWGIEIVNGQRHCACPQKAECGKDAGKHPAVAGGFHAAVGGMGADTQIRAWWKRGNGRWNLGVRTGGHTGSGLIVVDVDYRNGGDKSVDYWFEMEIPGMSDLDGWKVATGGGYHHYYRVPPEWIEMGRPASGRQGLMRGIDVKADGGYVVGPGSEHLSGLHYIPALPERAIPYVSEDFLRMLGKGGSLAGGRGLAGGWGGGAADAGKPDGYSYQQIRDAPAVPAGGRDVYFNELAFRLRVQGVDWGRAVQEIRSEWERTDQPAGDQYSWERAMEKLERVWETVPEGGENPVRASVAPPDTDTMSWLKSLMNGTASLPEEEEEDETGEEPPAPVVLEVLPPMEPAGESATDTGNALRYVRLLAGRVLYCREEEQWYVWDAEDGYWKPDLVDEALELTKLVVTDIRQESALCAVRGDQDKAAEWGKWAHRSESAGSRTAMLRLAASEPGIRMPSEDMNGDPWLLPILGGVTIELKTGKIRPSAPEDLMTRRAAVTPGELADGEEWLLEREGEGSLWLDHVQRMTRGAVEEAAWLQRYAGYSLTGSSAEQILAFLHGTGDNGKNAFLETLVEIMGTFATIAHHGILTASDEEHPTGLMSLKGMRLVMVDEIGRKRLNETRVKALTGGKNLKARGIGKDFVLFPAEAKIWVLGNALPAVKDPSRGFWRRVRLLNLKGELGKDGWKKILGFGDILLEQEKGLILAWMLQGLRFWHELEGCGETPQMRGDSGKYESEEDLFGTFLDAVLTRTGEDTDVVSIQALYGRYQLWYGLNASPEERRKMLNVNHFGRVLSARGPEYASVRSRVGGERERWLRGWAMRGDDIHHRQ